MILSPYRDNRLQDTLIFTLVVELKPMQSEQFERSFNGNK